MTPEKEAWLLCVEACKQIKYLAGEAQLHWVDYCYEWVDRASDYSQKHAASTGEILICSTHDKALDKYINSHGKEKW